MQELGCSNGCTAHTPMIPICASSSDPAQVDMFQMGLFFNITHAPWLASGNTSLHWQADASIRPDSPNDGNWWIPDIPDIQQRALSVRSITAMVDYLLRMPDAEVAQRLGKVCPCVLHAFVLLACSDGLGKVPHGDTQY